MRKICEILSLFLAFSLVCTSCVFGVHQANDKTPIGKYLRSIKLTEKKSGMKFIDCIYVINLDKRPERLACIKEQFSKVGLRLNRVRGVEGWLLTEDQKQELAGLYPVQLRPGEYGCLLSQVSIYEDAYKRGFSHIWILEDDAVIEKDVSQIPLLLKELSQIDPKWDVFYTDSDPRTHEKGYCKPTSMCPRPMQDVKPLAYYLERIKISENIQLIRSRWGTYSYIVSRKGIRKLRNYFFHHYIWTPVDWDMHLVQGIREYSALQDIVTNPLERGVSDTLGT